MLRRVKKPRVPGLDDMSWGFVTGRQGIADLPEPTDIACHPARDPLI